MENSHLSSLKAKHASLESRIAAEANRPVPDASTLHALKKRKLQIKDVIAQTRVN